MNNIHLMILIMIISIIALRIINDKRNMNKQQITDQQYFDLKSNEKLNYIEVSQFKEKQQKIVKDAAQSDQIDHFTSKRLLSEQISDRQKFYNQRPCPNITIIYTWVGNSTMPRQYSNYLQRCAKGIKLLGNQQLQTYINLWNKNASPEYILNTSGYPSNLLSTYLRKIYLYFQSGIYADFDTLLDQRCYQDIKTDQLLFTNYAGYKKKTGIRVAQQNFLMVQKKFNQQMKRMIQDQVKQIDQKKLWYRWNQCANRQCLIINCQQHEYDGSWKPQNRESKIKK